MQNDKFQNQPRRSTSTPVPRNHDKTTKAPAFPKTHSAPLRKGISLRRLTAFFVAIFLVLAICATAAGLFYSVLTGVSDTPADSTANSAVQAPSEHINYPSDVPAEKPEILTRENGTVYQSYTDETYRITAFYPETGNAEADRLIREKIDMLADESRTDKTRRTDGDTTVLIDFKIYRYQTLDSCILIRIQDGPEACEESLASLVYDRSASALYLPLADYDKSEAFYQKLAELANSSLKRQSGQDEQIQGDVFVASAESFRHAAVSADGLHLFAVSEGKSGSYIVEAVVDPTELAPFLPPAEEKPEPIDYTKEKVVAITFDDGPSKTYLPKILDKLEEIGGGATFFTVTDFLTAETGDMYRRAIELGCEIGIHTTNHSDLTKLTSEELDTVIYDAADKIETLTGKRPTLLRPPYGALTRDIAKQYPFSFILWNVDPYDWKYRDRDIVADHILENVQSGDIVLLHELYESSYEAFCEVADRLTEEGYRLVTISELYGLDGKTFDGSIYYSAGQIR